ncbi:TRNA (m(7)G46) methyltransferase subunit 1 [Giardia duodenalis assemblage B]|uniref:tRNA (M(7)G46) methyltransferase subunit 1 n=1 Tax=Giardia duodenalis assemblage B TaxID=1394984 RepID=A0A132NMV9_GIAIN|nr:TRNA (m(7)G46) methyltransferase subunit 1 [Giardia intestinalis assemblage B]
MQLLMIECRNCIKTKSGTPCNENEALANHTMARLNFSAP